MTKLADLSAEQQATLSRACNLSPTTLAKVEAHEFPTTAIVILRTMIQLLLEGATEQHLTDVHRGIMDKLKQESRRAGLERHPQEPIIDYLERLKQS